MNRNRQLTSTMGVRIGFGAALLAVTALSRADVVATAESGNPASVRYSYTGSTDTGDSTITAWFEFEPSAMSDRLVFWYEIPQHSFLISGNLTLMNGEYDQFLGGGITFPSVTPGPQNLPSFQSLVIQNSDTRYYVQADSFGDPSIFIGGPDGVGTVYHGQWAFVPVPEPASIGLIIVGAGVLLVLKARRAPPINKITGANAWGPRQLPTPTRWGARVAQFCR